MVYAGLVQDIADLGMLDRWSAWTGGLTYSGHPRIHIDDSSSLASLRVRCLSAVLPGSLRHLEDAISCLSNNVEALNRVLHANLQMAPTGEVYIADLFYKDGGRFNPSYEEDLKRFNDWEVAVGLAAIELTKAANWFADEVRANLNPLFFAQEGRFMIAEGPTMDLDVWSWVPAFSPSDLDLEPDRSDGV